MVRYNQIVKYFLYFSYIKNLCQSISFKNYSNGGKKKKKEQTADIKNVKTFDVFYDKLRWFMNTKYLVENPLAND